MQPRGVQPVGRLVPVGRGGCRPSEPSLICPIPQAHQSLFLRGRLRQCDGRSPGPLPLASSLLRRKHQSSPQCPQLTCTTNHLHEDQSRGLMDAWSSKLAAKMCRASLCEVRRGVLSSLPPQASEFSARFQPPVPGLLWDHRWAQKGEACSRFSRRMTQFPGILERDSKPPNY